MIKYKNSTFNLPNWTTVITAVSIPSTIAVYGNGKAIGLTNGSTNAGLTTGNNDVGRLNEKDTVYNANIATSGGGNGSFGNYNIIGLSKDTSGKSGIIAKSNSITRTSASYRFCIKY